MAYQCDICGRVCSEELHDGGIMDEKGNVLVIRCAGVDPACSLTGFWPSGSGRP